MKFKETPKFEGHVNYYDSLVALTVKNKVISYLSSDSSDIDTLELTSEGKVDSMFVELGGKSKL